MTKRTTHVRAFADLATQAPTALLDALAQPPVTCVCGNPGAKPRHWGSPDGPRAGWFCDDCEKRIRLGRLWLAAGNLDRATAAIVGRAA
jgi:hypothetical protein